MTVEELSSSSAQVLMDEFLVTKKFYDSVYENDHLSQYGGTEESMAERTSALRKKTKDWLELTGLANRPKAHILEIGCGMAYLSNIHPGWHGVEYSKAAVERVKANYGKDFSIFEGDAQNLTFDSVSVDGLYTWAALEHVVDPNKALEEIDRVLVVGGSALIGPAWNCRSWTVKKLKDRNYNELYLLEWLQKALIPLREHLLFRALVSIPSRLLGELQMLFYKKHLPLKYKKLYPRYDLIEKFGHVSDDDACANIDPHAAICFFKSRGYEILSHNSLLSRVLARHKPVVVKKLK